MYTKGEWWVDEGDFGYTIRAEQSIVKGFDEDDDVKIAEVNTYLDNEGEIEANAQLIAAAPELYEALKFLLDKYWKNQEEDNTKGFITCITPKGIPEYWKEVRQALAKVGK